MSLVVRVCPNANTRVLSAEGPVSLPRAVRSRVGPLHMYRDLLWEVGAMYGHSDTVGTILTGTSCNAVIHETGVTLMEIGLLLFWIH